jgi:hypothetical protein
MAFFSLDFPFLILLFLPIGYHANIRKIYNSCGKVNPENESPSPPPSPARGEEISEGFLWWEREELGDGHGTRPRLRALPSSGQGGTSRRQAKRLTAVRQALRRAGTVT